MNNNAAIQNISQKPWVNIAIPEGYSISMDGVNRQQRTDDWQMLSGPVWVTAFTRDQREYNKLWGVVINWIDRDNDLQSKAFPIRRLNDLSVTLAQELSSHGLLVVPGREKALIEYLGSFVTDERIKSVSKLGWMDEHTKHPTYVLPNQIITLSNPEKVIFQPEQNSSSIITIHSKGNLDQWKSFVADQCRGNDLLIFSLCVGFASPLQFFANAENSGFHLYGETSQGKTTALQVAATIFGSGADPGASSASYIHRWNSTSNALEGLAAAHNDGLLALDEMGSCGAKDFGTVVYDLMGGQEKKRLTKEAAHRDHRTWRMICLSTGEISVLQRIEENKTAMGGQLNRFLDIPINQGVITNTHGMQPHEFVNELKHNCSMFYGTAGPEFIKRVISLKADSSALFHYIKSESDTWTEYLGKNINTTPAQRRAIQRLALVLVAGLISVKTGVTSFTENEIISSIESVLDAWRRDSSNIPDTKRGINSLRGFILKHSTRFRDADSKNNNGITVHSLVGYYDKARGLYLLTDEGFKEAVEGFNLRGVLSELNKMKLLFKNNGAHNKSLHSIDGIGKRIGLFAIKKSIVEHDGS